MTPAQELRSLRAKLKRRDKKIAALTAENMADRADLANAARIARLITRENVVLLMRLKRCGF